MTDLDDGLDTSAPVFAPPKLTVFWDEALSTVENSGNPDALIYMDDQLVGSYKVEHSLDDGLPDAVTMTSGNDASGKASVPLIGRAGVEAATTGWRAPRTQLGIVNLADTVVELPTPTDAFFGDYILVGLTIDKTAAVTLTQDKGTNGETWKQLVGPVEDGSLCLYVFGKQYWPGMSGLRVSFNTINTTYSYLAAAAYARTANPNVWVDFEPMRPLGAAELSGVAVIPHTAPTVTLLRKGYAVSFWGLPSGSVAGPFVYNAAGVEIGEITSGLRLMMATSPLTDPGQFIPTANTTASTNQMVMASVALEVRNRPSMDARQFFSPFNKDSPVYGWDRDTARTYLVNNVVTPAGVVGTTIHSGQMADIGIQGRVAEMQSVSRTRIDMDGSLVLPVITADRENLSQDWLITWVMARGGQYAGPAPSRYTRMWAPLYGSTHAHYASLYTYNYAVYYSPSRTPSGPHGLRPPSAVQGPFMSAMYGKQTSEGIEEIFLNLYRLDLARERGLPGPYGSYLGEDWPFHDQLSKANTTGRITFWIRGDAVDPAPAYVADTNQHYMARYDLYCKNTAGDFLGYVQVKVSSVDRYVRVIMGADHTGNTSIVYNLAGQQIPTDGQWHFIGVKWNYALGQAEVCVDGVTSVSSAYGVNGDNDISLLPTTETAHYAAGNYYDQFVRFHVPVSDVCVEAGPETWTNDWSWHYPIPQGLNAIARPSFTRLQALAESSPLQGWELVAELAKSSMTAYRANEDDTFEWLPPKYFGEPEQIEIAMIADTEVNAAELDVQQDPSKTRNVVTVKFPDTRSNTKVSTVLDITAAIEVIKGVSEITLSLDTPAVEIHGQASPFGAPWTLTNLSDAQIAAPATIPTNVHFFTANTLQDATGTNLTNLSITAKVIRATASTVTIQFSNLTNKSVWLTNNGEQVPFMRILGYAVSITDGYVTERDAGSVSTRRERALDFEAPWIHTRDDARALAQALVTALARPRAEVNVTVMGDPRRRPGQMVQLKDSQGTQAEGTWRILAVTHIGAGAQYTQDLKLVYVQPIGVWDNVLGGWDVVNWAP